MGYNMVERLLKKGYDIVAFDTYEESVKRAVGLGAETGVDESARPAEMRGVGRIFVDEASDSAEFSVLVEQDWSRRGLGALLMQHLVDDCRRRGLAELWGYVLLENRPMLQLCKELGFTQRVMMDEPGTAQITLKL